MTKPIYISQGGLDELKSELEKRSKATRKEITKRIEEAKELGDLSENFEYHDAKDQQGLNEARIAEIEAMIKNAVVIEASSGGTIGLGSTFSAEFNGKAREFQLVGAAEANPMEGKISNESPLGKAFLGKLEGDSVEVEVPSGIATYRITEVKQQKKPLQTRIK